MRERGGEKERGKTEQRKRGMYRKPEAGARESMT